MRLHVSQKAAKVLNKITKGLNVGDSRKIDNSEGSFMAVHVERLHGNVYSVAHYYLQNGDMMADPDITFLKNDLGWTPLTYTQHSLGLFQVAAKIDASQAITHFSRSLSASLRSFTTNWMSNILAQQY